MQKVLQFTALCHS